MTDLCFARGQRCGGEVSAVEEDDVAEHFTGSQLRELFHLSWPALVLEQHLQTAVCNRTSPMHIQ
eukprot:3153607-Rhodomonas_salina.1